MSKLDRSLPLLYLLEKLRLRPEMQISAVPNLTVRARNALLNNGISQIGHLRASTDDDLLALKNFGRTSLDNLKDSLISVGTAEDKLHMEVGDQRKAGSGVNPGELRPLWVLARRASETLDVRHQHVFLSRIIGFGSQSTLQHVGDELGVSRERARQMENECIKRIKPIIQRDGWQARTDESLLKLRLNRVTPLSLQLLEERDLWFKGVASRPSETDRLFQLMHSKHAIGFSDSAAGPFITLRSCSDAGDLAKKFIGEFKPSRGGSKSAVLQLDELELETARFARSNGVPELAGVLLAELGDFVRGLGHVVIRPRIVDWIEATLRAAEKPLHIDEIDQRLRAAGHLLKSSSVRGALGRANVCRMGPSTFTVPDKLEQWNRLIHPVEAEVVALMEADPTRQWNALDLLRVLLDRGILDSVAASEYVVEFLLGQSQRIKSLGRGIWCLSGLEEAKRLSVTDVAKRILENNGAPMRRTLLAREVAKIRSLGIAGINLQWPLVLVGSGVVGLADRDLGLSETIRDQLVEELDHALGEASGEISFSRFHSLWVEAGGVDGTEIRCLIRALDSGQLVIDDVREMILRASETAGVTGNLRQSENVQHTGVEEEEGSSRAFKDCLENLNDGFNLREAVTAINSGLGRRLPEVTVRGRLSRAGYVEIDGKWYFEEAGT